MYEICSAGVTGRPVCRDICLVPPQADFWLDSIRTNARCHTQQSEHTIREIIAVAAELVVVIVSSQSTVDAELPFVPGYRRRGFCIYLLADACSDISFIFYLHQFSSTRIIQQQNVWFPPPAFCKTLIYVCGIVCTQITCYFL